MSNQLQKAIKLAKKTGDRIIIFDSAKTDSAYVIMSLDEYEKLIIGGSEVRGLTEDELLDKINRDIAIWKSEQDFDTNKTADFGRNDKIVERHDYSELTENEERQVSYPRAKKDDQVFKQTKKHWSIPSNRKEGAEEIIEEDRQYLENINY